MDTVMDIKDISMFHKVKQQIELNILMKDGEIQIINDKMAIQFSLIVLFSTIFPLGGTLILFFNIFKHRIINEEIQQYRRTIPQLTFGISSRLIGIFEFMSSLGIIGQITIEYFNNNAYKRLFIDGDDFKWKVISLLLFFVLIEHIIIFSRMIISWSYEWMVESQRDVKVRTRADKERAKAELRMEFLSKETKKK